MFFLEIHKELLSIDLIWDILVHLYLLLDLKLRGRWVAVVHFLCMVHQCAIK